TKLTGNQLHQGRLAGAIRTEQRREPRRDFAADVVYADHLAVPARDALQRDHPRTTSTARTRERASRIGITQSATAHSTMGSSIGRGSSRSTGPKPNGPLRISGARW